VHNQKEKGKKPGKENSIRLVLQSGRRGVHLWFCSQNPPSQNVMNNFFLLG